MHCLNSSATKNQDDASNLLKILVSDPDLSCFGLPLLGNLNSNH